MVLATYETHNELTSSVWRYSWKRDDIYENIFLEKNIYENIENLFKVTPVWGIFKIMYNNVHEVFSVYF